MHIPSSLSVEHRRSLAYINRRLLSRRGELHSSSRLQPSFNTRHPVLSALLLDLLPHRAVISNTHNGSRESSAQGNPRAYRRRRRPDRRRGHRVQTPSRQEEPQQRNRAAGVSTSATCSVGAAGGCAKARCDIYVGCCISEHAWSDGEGVCTGLKKDMVLGLL